MESLFLLLSFVDSASVLYASILWIPRYLKLFVSSMTSPLMETAGIACHTVLLLRVHHRTCALLRLISDSVFWHRCDTFSVCSWTKVTTKDRSCTLGYLDHCDPMGKHSNRNSVFNMTWKQPFRQPTKRTHTVR